ncbi:MAG TPA: VIT1/CCC1 transporter family protein [Methylomirabilota bacterium]|nr:VIT1/CCC1 transporter family protein [Methylomirabilota bacterium]
MLDSFINSRKHLLDPMDRISEILFGLIMVLTVTCSFSVAGAHRKEVHSMLLTAIGCNLAWGAIDAVFYLLARFCERGRGILALRALRKAVNLSEAQKIIAAALPPLLASVLTPMEFDLLRQRLNQLPEPPPRPHLSRDDWRAARGIFLLVFLTTFPVVIPFLFAIDVKIALRVSNGIAILMLFMTGYAFGRHAGRRPLVTGLEMVILSCALVGITIGLGG